jgi:hypothetical protein
VTESPTGEPGLTLSRDENPATRQKTHGLGECVVIGKRRKQPLPRSQFRESGVFYKRGIWSADLDSRLMSKLPRLGQEAFDSWRDGEPVELSRREQLTTWASVLGERPKRFEKFELTEGAQRLLESESALPSSRPRRPGLERPPLSLNKGHTSLLLLSGLLDGYVPSTRPTLSAVSALVCSSESSTTRPRPRTWRSVSRPMYHCPLSVPCGRTEDHHARLRGDRGGRGRSRRS